MMDLDKARAVCDKALKKISLREEGERMNVWVARLNLENAYGTSETLEKGELLMSMLLCCCCC